MNIDNFRSTIKLVIRQLNTYIIAQIISLLLTLLCIYIDGMKIDVTSLRCVLYKMRFSASDVSLKRYALHKSTFYLLTY